MKKELKVGYFPKQKSIDGITILNKIWAFTGSQVFCKISFLGFVGAPVMRIFRVLPIMIWDQLSCKKKILVKKIINPSLNFAENTTIYEGTI